MNNGYSWYSQLMKPSWAPPSWLFGPVWSVLYILIAVSYGGAVWLALQKKISWWTLLPFALNLVFNFIFTWLQFGLKNNYLAAADVLFVLTTIIWTMIVIYPHARWVAYLQIPYLAWVCFASVLQLTVTYLNR